MRVRIEKADAILRTNCDRRSVVSAGNLFDKVVVEGVASEMRADVCR